jgi:hypothetical protein
MEINAYEDWNYDDYPDGPIDEIVDQIEPFIDGYTPLTKDIIKCINKYYNYNDISFTDRPSGELESLLEDYHIKRIAYGPIYLPSGTIH